MNTLDDRLPSDWKIRRAKYSAAKNAQYARVLRNLKASECMTGDQCERAAYVIIEKNQLAKDDED